MSTIAGGKPGSLTQLGCRSGKGAFGSGSIFDFFFFDPSQRFKLCGLHKQIRIVVAVSRIQLDCHLGRNAIAAQSKILIAISGHRTTRRFQSQGFSQHADCVRQGGPKFKVVLRYILGFAFFKLLQDSFANDIIIITVILRLAILGHESQRIHHEAGNLNVRRPNHQHHSRGNAIFIFPTWSTRYFGMVKLAGLVVVELPSILVHFVKSTQVVRL
mmetsp:Transcript_23004/g.64028  ORF Transcript_23004/g.64028 Transcript_23004/m.64028 type:complete len:215 (-) Transcript_23004:875-1519(-)